MVMQGNTPKKKLHGLKDGKSVWQKNLFLQNERELFITYYYYFLLVTTHFRYAYDVCLLFCGQTLFLLYLITWFYVRLSHSFPTQPKHHAYYSSVILIPDTEHKLTELPHGQSCIVARIITRKSFVFFHKVGNGNQTLIHAESCHR